MTPTQLRAFAAVVRLGAVNKAAADLGVSEAAVSLHVGQLRKELGDRLFLRTSAGLAFTPGGLRLASRAAEMLGLQDQTILEVSQAGSGRRLLRVATSSLFAELCAPGLIELFAGRAADLDVELSVHNPRHFAAALHGRTFDVAIGPQSIEGDEVIRSLPLLKYTIVAVASPDDPMTAISPSTSELQHQTWLLGPSVVTDPGLVSAMVRRLDIPEAQQQIFQSHAAALEEAKRGKGIALVPSFSVAQDLASGGLKRVTGAHTQAQGTWHILTLAGSQSTTAAAEFARFATSPRAIQAMLRGAGVTVGRFRPSIHVTLWS